MLNQTSYHGAGAIAEIVTEAKAHAFQKAFVCSDPDLIKFGVTGKVTDLLDKEGLAVDFMLQLLDGKPLDTRDISLPTRLIERDSVRAL